MTNQELIARLEGGACHKCQHWRREGRQGWGICLGPFWHGGTYNVPDADAPETSWWEESCDLFSVRAALLKAEG